MSEARWRVLGLPFCCGRAVQISHFEKVGDAPDRYTMTIFRCGRCQKLGQRHEFDPAAAALDAQLGLPLDPTWLGRRGR